MKFLSKITSKYILAKPELKIKVTYDIVTPESAEQGDFAETGWENQEGEVFDSVEDAIEWLKREGIDHASSSAFHENIWYTGQEDEDYKTGAVKRLSYHLKGFSKDEQKQVYDAIK